MKYVAALFIALSAYASERTCDELSVQRTIEGTLLDGCREKTMAPGGCGLYLSVSGGARIELEDAVLQHNALKKLHGKTVTVTGMYRDDYPRYITQCEHGTPYRGAPQKYMVIDSVVESKEK